jgi:hypothetical protein
MGKRPVPDGRAQRLPAAFPRFRHPVASKWPVAPPRAGTGAAAAPRPGADRSALSEVSAGHRAGRTRPRRPSQACSRRSPRQPFDPRRAGPCRGRSPTPVPAGVRRAGAPPVRGGAPGWQSGAARRSVGAAPRARQGPAAGREAVSWSRRVTSNWSSRFPENRFFRPDRIASILLRSETSGAGHREWPGRY